MTAPQYVDESTPQLGTLLEVLYAAGTASEAHANATIDRTFWELMIATVLLIVGIAVAAGSMLMVVARVTGPLGKLTDAVQRLARNDTSAEIPAISASNELGLMAHALVVFKANMVEAAHLREEQAGHELQQSQKRKADTWSNWPTGSKPRSA